MAPPVQLSQKFMAFINTSFLLLLCFFVTSQVRSPGGGATFPGLAGTQLPPKGPRCGGLHELDGHHAKCAYIRSHGPCFAQGFVNYLHFYYCHCGGRPWLGLSFLAVWLLVLFYLLANTASHYFCSSVEKLSKVLNLPPAVAGVTLLSFGNGSPDVLASVVSFHSGAGEVGLSSVLGGGFFVSCVVVGIINLYGSSQSPSTTRTQQAAKRVDRSSFVRDVCFLIAALASLLVILLVGRINVWGAAAFTSLYFVYVSIVSVTHLCGTDKPEELIEPMLEAEVCLDDAVPIERDEHPITNKARQESALSSFMVMVKTISSSYLHWFLYLSGMPLYLPRRLTIPDISEEKFSRFYAVASATMAPILVTTLWNAKRGELGVTKKSPAAFMYGAAVGLASGILAACSTVKGRPPKKCLFPWLAGGFLMSVLWTYVIAEELVGLLVSMGYVFGISPAFLGLTVLAWGNSTGDMIANVAMAINGGRDGAQIAISGCYAGPLFNTLAGLGMSLLASAWGAHPAPFTIPVAAGGSSSSSSSAAVFEILGFMMLGLLWALVMLPRKGMKLDRTLGMGLLLIYLCFLSLRLSRSLGLLYKLQCLLFQVGD